MILKKQQFKCQMQVQVETMIHIHMICLVCNLSFILVITPTYLSAYLLIVHKHLPTTSPTDCQILRPSTVQYHNHTLTIYTRYTVPVTKDGYTCGH